MKLLPVPTKRKVAQPDLSVSNLDDSNYYPANPAKPPCNIDNSAQNGGAKRNVRSMMRSLSPFRSPRPLRSLSPFRSHRSLSKQRIKSNPAEDSTGKDMTFETATTASLSFSRTDEVADDAVNDNAVEDVASAVEANLQDVFVTGKTTFTSSEAADASREQPDSRPVLISVTSSAGNIFPDKEPGNVGAYPRALQQQLSPEQILDAAAEIPESLPERPLSSPDRLSEKPRYSFDILSGPMFDTPVRKYLFSDRFEDLSIIEDSTCGGSTVQEETTFLLKDAASYRREESEVDASTINSDDFNGQDSVYSAVEGSVVTYTEQDTTTSASFDREEKESYLPEQLPQFMKDWAVALQSMVEDVGNCSSYTMEQARQVEWVECIESRALATLRDMQSMGPKSRRRSTTSRNR